MLKLISGLDSSTSLGAELGTFAYVLTAGENALNPLFFVYGNPIPARCS